MIVRYINVHLIIIIIIIKFKLDVGRNYTPKTRWMDRKSPCVHAAKCSNFSAGGSTQNLRTQQWPLG